MSDENHIWKLSLDQLTRTAAYSERKKTAAKELAEEYGPVLDHFKDGVFITDEAGYFVFVNKAIEQTNGVPADTFIGRHFLELIDPKYHEFAQNILQKILQGEEIVRWIPWAGQFFIAAKL